MAKRPAKPGRKARTRRDDDAALDREIDEAIAEMPKILPGFYSPGERNEAQYYVSDHRALWKSVPGALAWLREGLPPSAP